MTDLPPRAFQQHFFSRAYGNKALLILLFQLVALFSPLPRDTQWHDRVIRAWCVP
eukprot:SAG11_NODE_2193_length_3702_cov_6.080242_2_plen_55_part_00